MAYQAVPSRVNYSLETPTHGSWDSVYRVFEDWAQRFPNAIAVQFGGDSICYSELNQRANWLARQLIDRGVSAGTPVGICLDPGLLLAIAVLGVLKAGGAYVPISSSYPTRRIAYILNDSQSPILLTHSSLVSTVGELSVNVIALDRILEASNSFDPDNLDCRVEPGQTAYVLYTSGSSGKPKGVMVPHESLAYYVQWHCQHLRKQIGDIDLPLTSSLCFAAAVTQFYTPLMLGRTLHILREDTIRQPECLYSWYRGHAEFGLYCVPTLWNELVTFAEEAQKAGNPLEGPKCVLLSGEAVNERLVDRSHTVWPEIKIWNLYGPTEATANASAGRLFPGQPVTLGKPIAGTQIYLVDEEMRQVGPGQTGELCICGDGVATGYQNLAKLSRERFLANPFERDHKQRLFRTGDLAKYNDKGELIFTGRKDFQVKVRGYRIECGEIEKALLEHESIRQTVVVCCEGPSLDKQLVGYLAFHFARYASVDEIRAFLAARLPDYMIPSAFVVLEAFPQLPNGKVDRGGLPPPGKARPKLGYAFVRPKSFREKQIVRIWEDVLGLEGVGANDNFFDLGGNSLKIAAATSRIREILRIDVSFRQFFEYPTAATLATALKGLEQDPRPLPLPIEEGLARSTYPGTVNQQSLWLLTQTFPDLSAYNMAFSLRLQGTLDFDALVPSLAGILKRHESLRTVIKVENDRPVLEILKFTEPTIGVVDLRELNGNVRDEEAQRLAAEDSNSPFQLENGPLYRFRLYQLAEDRHWLFVTVHHLVFDGRSISVFTKEFIRNYRAHRAGQLSQPSAAAIQCQDYLAWLDRHSGEKDYGRLLEFWKRNLKGSSLILDFPTDYSRPTPQTFNGAYMKVRLPGDLKDQMADFSRREQATPFMTMLAVFYALLYRYTNQEDILVGSPVANRNHSDIEELIGYFANIIVLRVKLARDQSFRELLATVRETCLQAFEHQTLPFAKLVGAIQPGKSLSHTPIFQVMFAWHEKLFKGCVDDQLLLDTHEDGNSAAKFDLVLDAQELESGIELRLTYNTDLFAEATIERFLQQYVRLLNNVLVHPTKSVSEYEMVSEAELGTITADWNSTASDNPRDRCLHHLFEEQVAKSPGQVALICGGQQLTYEALNRRANQFARYLIARGVQKGVMVGIHMERSAEMVVALLAILKAGGAYVPLDPYYPKERIGYIIRDSGVPVIVTQQNLEEQLAEHQAALISPDVEWEKIAEYASDDLPAGGLDPEALLYVMYTSGSTGQPKGVMVPHKGPCNYVLWMRDRFPLSARDKILSKTSINFDISVWEIFLPLIGGAQLVVGRDDDLQAPESLAALIQDEQITNIQFVPSALKAFADSGLLSSCDSLRRVFSGGEALSIKLREEVFESFSGELHNLYGPTEASIYVCHAVCRPEDRQRSVPIGRPVHNSRVYILDAQLKPVAAGMTGEVYIGGEVLANGYLNQPDATAACFLPDPYLHNARMFKTGDLARSLCDGQIEFLGRADRQVKVRGYRIELGEIEHSLNRHPQVKHAIVIVREDNADDVRLVAYLLYRDKSGPENGALRDYLKQKLPDYMIPSTFVELDSIPLLPNDKVNIKALPRPEFKKNLDKALERNYRNDCEKVLAQIWEEVLETEKFGPDDNFFDVGGHSLLIVKLRSLIKQRLGIGVSNLDLFQYASIRSLAGHLANHGKSLSQLAADMAQRAALRNQRLKPRVG